MNHAACYKQGYPRPRFVRDSFVDLNGEWEFAFDGKETGMKNGFHKGKELPLTIRVPYAYNTPASGLNVKTDYAEVWYKKTFDYALPLNRRLLVNFDGADYFADVWLNGEHIGSHEGGYTRFTFDLTHALKPTGNELVVCCRDPFDPAYPRGKQRHLNRNTGCFYLPTVGLWKSVWLEETAENYLIDVYPEIRYEDCATILHYRVNEAAQSDNLYFTAKAYFMGEFVTEVSGKVVAPEGKILLDLENRKQQLPVKPWTAGNSKQFFDVVYELKKGGKTIDTVGSYLGLVDYRADKNRILIDYLSAAYLRMVLAQGYYPEGGLTGTEEELLKDVRLIKDMGFNGVRIHQKIEDDRFYYFCDMVGLYAWCEMPSPYVTDDRTMSAFTGEWQEIVRQHRGFISTMAFVPFNESWGALQVLENKRQQAFVTAAYWLTKSLVPERFVVGNDGWEHTETDLLTVHNYVSSGESLFEAYSDIESFAKGERVKDLCTRTAFADGFEYKGQPIVVSEFGGVKYSPDSESWGYGNAAKSPEELYERTKALVAGITANKKISGYCLTQFTDVYQEKNGLVCEDRTPKIPIEKIKEINSIY